MIDESKIDIDALPKLDDDDEVAGHGGGLSGVVNMKLGALHGLGFSDGLIKDLTMAGVLRTNDPTHETDEDS